MATKKPTRPRAPTKSRGRTPKGGRPTKCTPKVTKAVCDAILKLATREDAARAAGIAPRTMYEWLARGAAGDPDFVQFLQAVEDAESELVRFAGEGMKTLAEHADTPPAVKLSAYKFILERKRPKDFGPRPTVTHEGPDGGPIPVAAEVAHSGAVEVSGPGGGAIPVRPLLSRDELRLLGPDGVRALIERLEQDDDDEGDDTEGGAG